MLGSISEVLLFVPDIDLAARWYAGLFGVQVQHENPRFAFIDAPGVRLGFHPADAKCPGGVGGTSVYWDVEDLDAAIAWLQQRGARLHRGPMVTRLGAGAALMIDPFGCTLGLNRRPPRPASAPAPAAAQTDVAGAAGLRLTVHDTHAGLPALALIDQGLEAHNLGEPALQQVRPLGVVAEAADASVAGGAVGRSWGACCELQQLWVGPRWRRQGVGARLMARFEAAAAARGCRLVYLDTFSFQAPGFYARLGYRTVLLTPGFSDGIVKHTLHQALAPGP